MENPVTKATSAAAALPCAALWPRSLMDSKIQLVIRMAHPVKIAEKQANN